MSKKISYKAKGMVLGNLWGGGVGFYPIKTIKTKTREELIQKAKDSLLDGSLDDGMGFESIIGALLDITITTKVEISDEVYIHKKYEYDSVGKLSDEQHDYLMEVCLFN